MNQNEILEKVQTVFRDVFDNDSIEITPDTRAEDIEEWDSLSHVQLIVELEKEFSVKLTSKEIFSWDNVGEMVQALETKIDNK
jgi:acyl carrier protein